MSNTETPPPIIRRPPEPKAPPLSDATKAMLLAMHIVWAHEGVRR